MRGAAGRRGVQWEGERVLERSRTKVYLSQNLDEQKVTDRQGRGGGGSVGWAEGAALVRRRQEGPWAGGKGHR